VPALLLNNKDRWSAFKSSYNRRFYILLFCFKIMGNDLQYNVINGYKGGVAAPENRRKIVLPLTHRDAQIFERIAKNRLSSEPVKTTVDVYGEEREYSALVLRFMPMRPLNYIPIILRDLVNRAGKGATQFDESDIPPDAKIKYLHPYDKNQWE